MFYRSFQLRVFPLKRRMGQVIHDEIRINAMTFDEPLAFRSVHADFSGARHAAVHEPALGGQPDFAAPGARADDFAESESFEALAERFAVAGGFFVA